MFIHIKETLHAFQKISNPAVLVLMRKTEIERSSRTKIFKNLSQLHLHNKSFSIVEKTLHLSETMKNHPEEFGGTFEGTFGGTFGGTFFRICL